MVGAAGHVPHGSGGFEVTGMVVGPTGVPLGWEPATCSAVMEVLQPEQLSKARPRRCDGRVQRCPTALAGLPVARSNSRHSATRTAEQPRQRCSRVVAALCRQFEPITGTRAMQRRGQQSGAARQPLGAGPAEKLDGEAHARPARPNRG